MLAPIARARKGELKLELERLRREGFVRAPHRRLGRRPRRRARRSTARKAHDLDVVVDRLVLKEGLKGRLTDSVELALKLGEGRLLVQPRDDEPFWMSERFACIDCGISLPPIEPRMFSFNGPHGACPACDGLGARDVVDPERCVGDARRTLREGVGARVGPARGSVALATELSRAVEALGVSPDVPWAKLPEERAQGDPLRQLQPRGTAAREGRRAPKRGGEEKRYEGIVPRLEARLERSPTSASSRRRRRPRQRTRAASPTTSSGASSSRARATPARASACAPRRSR